MKTIRDISRKLLLLSLLSAVTLVSCKDSPVVADKFRPDNIKVDKIGGTVAPMFVAPGDTLNYKLTLSSFGTGGATGAQFTVTASGSGWIGRPIRQATTTLTTDFKLINTTAWITSTFKLYAWGTRGAVVSRDSTLIATWTVTREVGPPPGGTIDSSLVITIRNSLNPENLASISPVTVHLSTDTTNLACPGEWAGAKNRSLRILPTFATNVECAVNFRSLAINVDALYADSLTRAEPDTSIYKSPPLPWGSSNGPVLKDDIDNPPILLAEGIKPDNITIEVGQTFQLCYVWSYNDGTDYDTCLPGRRIVQS